MRSEVLLGIFDDGGQVLAQVYGVCWEGDATSSRNPRIWLISAVRLCTNRSRTRCIAFKSSCSSVLICTKRMFSLLTPSAIASASMKSFLLDFRTFGRV
jgi:hypothetical protein